LPDASLAVFKLHGSLNWLRCETCGHVTINTTERIVSLDAWQVQNQYNSCECGGLLKSLLVTPSIVRNIRDPSLLAIWNAALEDLRLADQWIFIGYSLPSEDVAIRSLLLRAFHTRKNRKRLRVQVVSFESDEPAAPLTPQAAFRMFFPRSHFPETAYEAGGVEEFVGRLT
jgi:NAD-dependent SIR2 family protein deacetylase